MTSMRLVYVVRDQSLRIASAVVRGFDFADEVVVISLTKDEECKRLVEEAGGIFVYHDSEPHAPELAKTLISLDLDEIDRTIAVGLDSYWKLKDLPMNISLARSGHDIYIAFKHRSANERTEEMPDEGSALTIKSYYYEDAAISVCSLSPKGIQALAKANSSDRPSDLPSELSVRIIELDTPIEDNQLESLTSASRFAQLFYWMLESKHPLILFGIPGISFFIVGYQMASALIDIGGPHDPVSLGVALAAFTVTFIGVLSLISALVLYVLGKQIDKLQLDVR